MHSNKKKKIALFLGALHGGGAQRVMINLASGFIVREVQVDLVLADADGAYLNNVPSNISLINLNSGRVLYSIPRFIKYLRNERPEVVLSTVGHANLAALIAKRLSGVNTRLFIRVENTISESTADETSVKSRLLKLLIRYIYSWSDGIITPSQGVANDLIENMNLPARLMHVIYNPVVRPEILNKASQPLTHPWFQPNGLPVVIAVGRLTKQKDFSTLIKAFFIVTKVIRANLIILGEGEDRQELENLILNYHLKDSVQLPGFVDNPYNYIAKSSVYVLSSLWEGLPNTLIEAMAVGTPVVATNCKSGPDEILSNGKYGWLAQMGNSESIAEGIIKALTTDDFPKPDHQAMQRFQLDSVVNDYLKVLLTDE